MIKTFLYNHRKQIAGFIGVLLLCGLSFALGRFNQEETVRVEERVVEKVVEKIVEVEVEKIVEKKVFVDNTKTRTKVVVVEAPDGTKTSTTDVAVDTDVKNESEKAEERVVYVDREKIVEVEVEKKVETSQTLPDWRIGALVGANPLDMWSKQAVVFGDLALGAEVQRRIVGPVYGGVWGTTQGAVGVSVGLEF